MGDGQGAGTRIPVVEVRGLCFGYDGERVLDDITLTVAAGDFLGIIGPNGSGKTTLVKLMMGLLRPSCGEIRLFGVEVARFAAWQRVGYVPQRVTAFDPRFPATVEEIVASGRAGRAGLLRGYGPDDRRAEDRALETVGLTDLRARLIGQLPSGQQQRAFIARALVSEPELLVLAGVLVAVVCPLIGVFLVLRRLL